MEFVDIQRKFLKFKFYLFLKTLFLWSFVLDNAKCQQSVNNKYGIHILVYLRTFSCISQIKKK